MENRGITLVGVMQLATLIVGWIIASITVRHGPTWNMDFDTFGKTYRSLGLILAVIPILWTGLTIRAINRESSIQLGLMIVAGVGIMFAFILISLLAVMSGMGAGQILGKIN